MKKILTFFIIGLFLLSGASAQLPPVPMPVDITATVNGVLINDIVDVQDKVTGETLKVKAVNGRIVFDMEDFTQTEAYDTFGHTIKIRVCDSTSCILEFVSSSKKFPFRATITGSDTGYVTKYVCWDDSLVDNLADCPTQPVAEKEVETTKISEQEAKITSYYGQEVNVVLGDSKLASLQDKEIKFNNKDYNIKEEMTIKGKVLTSLDDEDFSDKPYLTLKEGDIVYKYIFEDAIPKNEVTEDEPLKISLLGKEVEIVSMSDSKITLMSGKVITIEEGATKDNIKAETITSNKAYLVYNGEGNNLEEGELQTIGGMDFYIIDIMENEAGETTGGDRVEIRYGKEVKTEIENDDDYEEEEIFKWIITTNSIGITNQQEYKDIDEDSDYKALAIGELITLPNNFAQVKFSEATNQKVSELKIKVKDSALYVTSANSELSYGTEEYDRLYVKSNGFYDKDNVLITSTGKIKIADGDNYLELGSLKIGLLTIPLDMNDILYNGVSFKGKDGTYLDYFGLIFSDPEQAVEDKTGFVVKVPEERPESVILISSEVVAEQPIEVPTTPELITPEQPEVIPEEKPITIPETETQPELEVIVKEKIICADGTEVTDKILCPEPEGTNWLLDVFLGIIGMVLAILGYKYAWVKGFAAMWKKKVESAKTQEEKKKAIESGTKAINTVFQKDKEGKYKK